MAPILSRRSTARQTVERVPSVASTSSGIENSVVGVGEQAEDVVRGTDTKDIGVRVGIRIDTDSFAISVTV